MECQKIHIKCPIWEEIKEAIPTDTPTPPIQASTRQSQVFSVPRRKIRRVQNKATKGKDKMSFRENPLIIFFVGDQFIPFMTS